MFRCAPSSVLITAVALMTVCVCAAAFATAKGAAANAILAAGTAAVALAAMVFTLRKRTVVGLVACGGFVAFGAAAAALYQPTEAAYYGSAPYVAEFAAHTPSYQYLLFFLFVACALWIGFLIAAPRPAGRQTLLELVTSEIEHRGLVIPASLALLVALLPLVLDVYGTGFHTVFHAAAYLERTGPPVAFKVGRNLGPVGLMVLGYLFFADRRVGVRAAAAVIATAYAALYLGTATRNLALVLPMMYVGGLLSGEMSVAQRRLWAVVAIAGGVIMLEVPLALRALPLHGLAPAVNYLIRQPGTLLANPVQNALNGAPLSLYVGQRVSWLPTHDLVTSLNPLPSSLTDWAKIGPSLGLNEYEPYSAVGELANYGWLPLFGVMMSFGIALGLLERLVLRSIAPRLGVLALTAVSGLIVIRSTEYNLRSVARLIYYVAAAVGVLYLMTQYASDRRRRSHEGGGGLTDS